MAFMEADRDFAGIDLLLRQANSLTGRVLNSSKNPPVHVVYSTPACFLRALHDLNSTWAVYRGDLMPYTDVPGRTWTGFFTTRPNLKYFVRYANGFLQVSRADCEPIVSPAFLLGTGAR